MSDEGKAAPERGAQAAKPRGWLARALGLGPKAEPPGSFDFQAMQRSLDSLAARSQPGE